MQNFIKLSAAVHELLTVHYRADSNRTGLSPKISFTVPAIVRAMLRGRIVLAMSMIVSNVKLPLCLTETNTQNTSPVTPQQRQTCSTQVEFLPRCPRTSDIRETYWT